MTGAGADADARADAITDDAMAHPAAVVLLAHGSKDPRHRVDIESLARRCEPLVGRPVRVAYLDHHRPSTADVSARLPRPAVVALVPALLSTGFHARVDVPTAAAALAGPGREVIVTAPLGPDPTLDDAAAELLRRGGVDPAYSGVVRCSAATTDLDDRCQHARAAGFEPVVVAWLLADGVLRDQIADRCANLGARLVEGTLGQTEAVAALVARRVADVAVEIQPSLTSCSRPCSPASGKGQ